MRVLIACEFSGIVREAFKAKGHDAWSCDLLPTEIQGNHILGDIIPILQDCWENWDMMVAFPPRTHLAVSGARWFKNKKNQQSEAIDFFMRFANSPIPKIAIENPISIMSTLWRKPDQIIQPWQFGHPETKATCLWLKNLVPLKPEKIVDGRKHRIHELPPSKDRGKIRSKTFQGIANAMAKQWG